MWAGFLCSTRSCTEPNHGVTSLFFDRQSLVFVFYLRLVDTSSRHRLVSSVGRLPSLSYVVTPSLLHVLTGIKNNENSFFCAYVVHSIRSQSFFVQAFKIVVHSWKFTMLLLYILWDDRPILMMRGLNEQLQQQLEYTLLKPDCHSWWISKMQSRRQDTLGEWYAIKFCFKLGKNATETYGMLQTAFQPSCMNRASVFKRYKIFKEGGESVRNDERCGRSKEVRTPEMIGQRVRVRVIMLRF